MRSLLRTALPTLALMMLAALATGCTATYGAYVPARPAYVQMSVGHPYYSYPYGYYYYDVGYPYAYYPRVYPYATVYSGPRYVAGPRYVVRSQPAIVGRGHGGMAGGLHGHRR